MRRIAMVTSNQRRAQDGERLPMPLSIFRSKSITMVACGYRNPKTSRSLKESS
jgi:hypothetical protein